MSESDEDDDASMLLGQGDDEFGNEDDIEAITGENYNITREFANDVHNLRYVGSNSQTVQPRRARDAVYGDVENELPIIPQDELNELQEYISGQPASAPPRPQSPELPLPTPEYGVDYFEGGRGLAGVLEEDDKDIPQEQARKRRRRIDPIDKDENLDFDSDYDEGDIPQDPRTKHLRDRPEEIEFDSDYDEEEIPQDPKFRHVRSRQRSAEQIAATKRGKREVGVDEEEDDDADDEEMDDDELEAWEEFDRRNQTAGPRPRGVPSYIQDLKEMYGDEDRMNREIFGDEERVNFRDLPFKGADPEGRYHLQAMQQMHHFPEELGVRNADQGRGTIGSYMGGMDPLTVHDIAAGQVPNAPAPMLTDEALAAAPSAPQRADALQPGGMKLAKRVSLNLFDDMSANNNNIQEEEEQDEQLGDKGYLSEGSDEEEALNISIPQARAPHPMVIERMKNQAYLDASAHDDNANVRLAPLDIEDEANIPYIVLLGDNPHLLEAYRKDAQTRRTLEASHQRLRDRIIDSRARGIGDITMHDTEVMKYVQLEDKYKTDKDIDISDEFGQLSKEIRSLQRKISNYDAWKEREIAKINRRYPNDPEMRKALKSWIFSKETYEDDLTEQLERQAELQRKHGTALISIDRIEQRKRAFEQLEEGGENLFSDSAAIDMRAARAKDTEGREAYQRYLQEQQQEQQQQEEEGGEASSEFVGIFGDSEARREDEEWERYEGAEGDRVANATELALLFENEIFGHQMISPYEHGYDHDRLQKIIDERIADEEAILNEWKSEIFRSDGIDEMIEEEENQFYTRSDKENEEERQYFEQHNLRTKRKLEILRIWKRAGFKTLGDVIVRRQPHLPK